ncbi:hypothetical protein XENTR_v10008796 [Xenopus tropicalis]|nr:hypothetical protein XENTR_v10008796 [Xenopus tropicalis]
MHPIPTALWLAWSGECAEPSPIHILQADTNIPSYLMSQAARVIPISQLADPFPVPCHSVPASKKLLIVLATTISFNPAALQHFAKNMSNLQSLENTLEHCCGDRPKNGWKETARRSLARERS